MMRAHADGRIWIWLASAVALLFGLLSMLEGGAVLFWSDVARRSAGHYVPFVVWFNFLAGFAYVICGAGLLFRQSWSVTLAFVIAVATLAVFIAFGVHIAGGGGYELRTVIAMSLRSAVWIAIAAAGYQFVRMTRGGDGA